LKLKLVLLVGHEFELKQEVRFNKWCTLNRTNTEPQRGELFRIEKCNLISGVNWYFCPGSGAELENQDAILSLVHSFVSWSFVADLAGDGQDGGKFCHQMNDVSGAWFDLK